MQCRRDSIGAVKRSIDNETVYRQIYSIGTEIQCEDREKVKIQRPCIGTEGQSQCRARKIVKGQKDSAVPERQYRERKKRYSIGTGRQCTDRFTV